MIQKHVLYMFEKVGAIVSQVVAEALQVTVTYI